MMFQKVSSEFFNWLRKELKSEMLLPSLTSGVLIGISEVIFALSVGSLIFSGELAPYLPYGIGIALVSTTIMLVTISLGSSVPGLNGSLQDSPSVILALIAATLVSTLSVGGVEDKLATVLAAIATTTLLTGVFLLALGVFKLGGLVRFLPYPVVGGFLAGTGWLLVQGSFSVMADFPLTFYNIPLLLQPDQLILWIPGLLFALVLFIGPRRFNHFLVAPGILTAFVVLFYLALLVRGISIKEATDMGLLLGELSKEAIWQPLLPQNLVGVDWTAILGQSGNIAILLVVSVVSLLLNASALELDFKEDINLNRELQVAGIANLLSGFGGGAVGYHALNLSTLCNQIGARGRLSGLLAGTISAVMLFLGARLLAFFPKPILGGLLLFMGLGFLVEWVIHGWSKLPHADYAVVVLILVVIGATDFLVGVGVGLVAMIILFVLSYSRVNVIRHSLSGGEMRSNVDRSIYHQRLLREFGQQIHILGLQGFIFFGTANGLLEKIRDRLAAPGEPQVRYIILDFRRVIGLDSSAVICFVKGKQLAEAQDITLVFTNVSDRIRRQFALSGLAEDERVRFFPDLDHGMEWCEDQLLDIRVVTKLVLPERLKDQLVTSGFEKAETTRLTAFLEVVQVEKGEYLIRQGEKSDDLYFIEQGSGAIYLELKDNKRVRLRTLGAGTVVGELSFYLSRARTASVIADSPTTAYRLTRTALAEMREKQPELAAVFHEFMVRILSERLVDTTRLLEDIF